MVATGTMFLVIALFLAPWAVRSQEAAVEGGTSVPLEMSFTTAAASSSAGAAASPRSEPEEKVDKEKFRKSRLTLDESEGTADRRQLLLSTGEDKAIDLDFEANAGTGGISIGNPQLVATTLVKAGERRQIVFKPLKSGDTTVTVRDADGTIRLIFDVKVTGSNLLKMASEIRDLLLDIEGIEVRIVGQKVVVDGEVLVPADYARLLSVVQDKVYADTVLNLTILSPIAMQMLSKRIQEDINAFAPNVKTRVVNGMIFLEGTTDNIDQAKRAADVARLYLPEVRPGNPLVARDPGVQIIPNRHLVQNFIVVNPPPPKKQEKLVRVTFHFVELAKDYNKVFGFIWRPGFTSDPQIAIGSSTTGGATASGPSFSATISSLFPKLESAQQAGFARILKTGTVIVRSGQKAELKDEHEIPYTVLGTNGQAGQAKEPVGLRVTVVPQILGQSEDIEMGVDLEQKSVKGRALAAGALPLISRHQVNTKIYVKSNESAAVAGVQGSDVGTDFNKDDPKPGQHSGGTEALFTLNRSKAYRKSKSQFVIFVTPQIIENASEGTEDLKKNFRVKVK